MPALRKRIGKSGQMQECGDMRGQSVSKPRPKQPRPGPLRSNINLNKGFTFVRKFAAYSIQIWTKLDRPRQRRLQSSLLALQLRARDVPQGIGCHVLSIAHGVLARARARPVAERLRTTASRQSGCRVGSDFGRICDRRRLAPILRASTGRLHGRLSRCKSARLQGTGRREDALRVHDRKSQAEGHR